MTEKGRSMPLPKPSRAELEAAKVRVLDCILREGGRLHASDYKKLLGEVIVDLEERLGAAKRERRP